MHGYKIFLIPRIFINLESINKIDIYGYVLQKYKSSL